MAISNILKDIRLERNLIQEDLAEATGSCSRTIVRIEYYGAAEPPVRCDESHLSGLTEPPHLFCY